MRTWTRLQCRRPTWITCTSKYYTLSSMSNEFRFVSPLSGYANSLFDQSFSENCMKMKKFWPKGGRLLHPLDPPMWTTRKVDHRYIERKFSHWKKLKLLKLKLDIKYIWMQTGEHSISYLLRRTTSLFRTLHHNTSSRFLRDEQEDILSD